MLEYAYQQIEKQQCTINTLVDWCTIIEHVMSTLNWVLLGLPSTF
jgi:hypothetical protein